MQKYLTKFAECVRLQNSHLHSTTRLQSDKNDSIEWSLAWCKELMVETEQSIC